MRLVELVTRWISLLLFGAILASLPLAAVGVHPRRNELEQWQGKADVLQLKDGRILPGNIVEIKKGGVVFDPQKLSLVVNPPPEFYPFSDIRKLVRKNGQIVYPKTVPAEKIPPVYTLSVLGSRLTRENSTYLPVAVEGQRLTKRATLMATFVKSFNVDQGVGCCECVEPTPPHSYHVRYSTYLWRMGVKLRFKSGGFDVGAAGGYRERGWCEEGSAPNLLTALPYVGAWGMLTSHVSVGLKFLVVPYGTLKAGVRWQSQKSLSNVWVGVIYWGERIPRLSDLRPSFRVQMQIRKNWLVHLRLYQFNQRYFSPTPRFLFVGIGRVFNSK